MDVRWEQFEVMYCRISLRIDPEEEFWRAPKENKPTVGSSGLETGSSRLCFNRESALKRKADNNAMNKWR